MNLRRTVIKVFFSDISTTVIGFASLLYFTRTLGPQSFGSYVLFQSVVTLVGFSTDAGIGGAVRKRLSEGESGVFVTGIIIKVCIVVVAIAISVPFLHEIDKFIGESLAIYFIPGLISAQSGRYLMVTLEGQRRVDVAAMGQLLQRSSFAIMGVLLIIWRQDAVSLVYAFILSWLLSSIWYAYHLEIPTGRPSIGAASSVFNYAKYNLVTFAGSRVYAWTDTVIIGLLLGQSAVGIYEVAWRISYVATILSKSIGRTLLPEVSKLDTEGVTRDIRRIVPDALTGAILFPVPAIVGIIVLNESLIIYTFGMEYAPAVIPLVILIVGRLFEAVRDIISRIVFGVDRPDLVAKTTVLFILVNLSLNLILVWKYGLVGAATATSLSFAIVTVLLAYYLHQIIPFSIDLESIALILISSLIMGIFIQLLRTIIHIDNYITLFSFVILGTVSYLVIISTSEKVRDTGKRIVTESS
jgi:O-antigen/teichoic acid export membrane protein